MEDDGGGDIAGRAGTVVAVVATSVWCLAAIGSPALAITAACAATGRDPGDRPLRKACPRVRIRTAS